MMVRPRLCLLATPLLLALCAPALADGGAPERATEHAQPPTGEVKRERPARGGAAWWAGAGERGWVGLRLSGRDQARRALAAAELPDEWLAVHDLPWLAEDWDGVGALVLGVFPESPAERAGILPGDVVITFNGIRIPSPGFLAFVAQKVEVGYDANLKLLREGESRELLVEIGMHPEDRRRIEEEERAAAEEKVRGAEAPEQ